MASMKESEGDWLASLARQSASSESNRNKPNEPPSQSRGKGRGGGGAGNVSVEKNIRSPGGDASTTTTTTTPSFSTKAQRIERRDFKRTQREERKRSAEEARRQRLAGKRQKKKASERGVSDSTASSIAGPTRPPGGTKAPRPRPCGRSPGSGKRRGTMTTDSVRALSRLSASLECAVSSSRAPPPPKRDDDPTILRRGGKGRKRPAEDGATTTPSSQVAMIVNGVPAGPVGKAARRSTLRAGSKELQPRVRDYNGQGLVRPSLYIPLDDPAFVPKLEMEFEEHVAGFFGKSKKKAAKKDEDMLWRRCLKAKEEEEEGGTMMGGKKNGRKGKGGEGGLDERLKGMMRQI